GGETMFVPEDLDSVVDNYSPGATVPVTILDTSNGINRRNISVTLGALPGGAQNNAGRKPNAPDANNNNEIYNGFSEFDKYATPSGKKRQTGPSATPNANSGQRQTQPATQNFASRAPVPVQALRGAYCGAFAPAGWGIIDQDPQGRTVTFSTADQRMKAAY